MKVIKEEEEILKEPYKELIKEEVEHNLGFFFIIFLVSYVFSYMIPGIISCLFLIFFFGPYILNNNNLISLIIQWKSLLILILVPFVIIGCYLIHLFFMALITRIFWQWTEKISPTKSGIIPRNIHSKTLHLYHIRSFLYKYPKNLFRKGIFPWLTNWLYNFVGISKIGKGTTIEDQFAADKFLDVGKNCYLGVGSGISSHFVEGIFGNISYSEIKFGDNVTLGGFCNIAPGCELGDNSYLLPLTAATKHNKTEGNNYYFGMPLRRIFKKKTMQYLKVSEEDLEKAEELRKKQEQQKKMKNEVKIDD